MFKSKKIKKIYFFAFSLILIIVSGGVFCKPVRGSETEEIGAALFFQQSDKQIALTFDDGPHYKYTPMILDSLKKYNAKATFFVIGERIRYSPEIIQRIHNEGHVIGNHTYTHMELTGISPERIRSEITKTNEAIFELINENPILLRPPLGARNKKTDAILKDEGMAVILWNIDTSDWRNENTSKIVNHVKKNASDGDIILMHDFYSQSAEAVEKILEELIPDGFKFVTVNDLLKEKFKIEPGKVYYSQKRRLK